MRSFGDRLLHITERHRQIDVKKSKSQKVRFHHLVGSEVFLCNNLDRQDEILKSIHGHYCEYVAWIKVPEDN